MHAGIPGQAPRRAGRPCSSGPVRHGRLSRALGRPDPAHRARRLGLHDRRRGRRVAPLDLGRPARAAGRDGDGRHPLRHALVEARHELGGRLGRHAARGRRDRGRLRASRSATAATRPTCRSTTSPAARPGSRTATTASRSIPSTAARRACSCRICTSGRARSGCAGCADGDRRARLLGVERLPPVRRPVAGAAVLGRLDLATRFDRGGASRDTTGQDDRPRRPRLARAIARVSTSTSGSPRRTATRPSGVTRSPRRPDGERVRADGRERRRRRGLAVPDGGSSGRRRAGDPRAVGGYFVWDADHTGPVLFVGGGSGIVPLTAMPGSATPVPTTLLYSARSLEDVIYRDELERLGPRTASTSCSR